MIKAEARRKGVTAVWATVSPGNAHSYANLQKHGFVPYQKGVTMYGKHLRDILTCNIAAHGGEGDNEHTISGN